jgi:hypothetical protein
MATRRPGATRSIVEVALSPDRASRPWALAPWDAATGAPPRTLYEVIQVRSDPTDGSAMGALVSIEVARLHAAELCFDVAGSDVDRPGSTSSGGEASEREAKLLCKIGGLTVERDS